MNEQNIVERLESIENLLKQIIETLNKPKKQKQQRTPKENILDDLYPWCSKAFALFDDPDKASNVWTIWKEHKASQNKFTYKSSKSESIAIKDLAKKSKDISGNIRAYIAQAVVERSIANGWQGLFQFKPEELPQEPVKKIQL